MARLGNMLGALSTRLSLAFIALIFAVGVGVLLVNQWLMQVYFEEYNQKLNASIAMYITGEYELMRDRDGSLDIQVFKRLAHHAMVINPAVEVYVLDLDGTIIAHNFPAETILHQQVPLAPLQAFLAGEASFPLRNIDPRQISAQKVFSAAEIRVGDRLQGYLYVVLAGAPSEALEDNLMSSYSRTQGAVAILLIVMAAGLSGWFIFKFLVQPLSQLNERMRNFPVAGLALGKAGAQSSTAFVAEPGGDEVMQLARRFDAMSAQISAQFEQLREADRLKRELFSNISHDLSTPLVSIQGYLETLLIKDESLSEGQRRDYLNTALKSSRRLAALIADLFELSKLEANQVQPVMERFSLAELLQDIVQEFSLELEEKQIAIEMRNPQENALVYADISMMQRVFENLLRNAIAHTPPEGNITLSIQSSEHNGYDQLKISVADTGCGIAVEDLPHIFERYYHNASRSSRGDASTGLGLAIVKRILDLHGAEILVSSQPNQGSRFEFYLPVAG